MNTNKPKPTKNTTLQIVSHDRWISMNSLQSLAQPDAEKKEIKATEKAEEQQTPKWVKWPSLPGKDKK